MRILVAGVGLFLSIAAADRACAQSAGSKRDVQSGNYWQELCRSTHSQCTGFVAGLLDLNVTMEVHGRRPLWCAPDGVTYGQAVKIVATYGEKNPTKLHLLYAELATTALAEAFPCKQNPN